jgi:ribosome-associated protein
MPAPAAGTGVADQPDERPSKTQRKNEMHELQRLGVALAALSTEQLARFDLPENLAEALRQARHVTSHEGRRRHLQYVGKLMRQVDAEDVRRTLGAVTGESREAVALMHRAEQWRERLLADDAALTDLVAVCPQADVQALRASIRSARREVAEHKPPRHLRELYRTLHALLGAPLDSQATG